MLSPRRGTCWLALAGALSCDAAAHTTNHGIASAAMPSSVAKKSEVRFVSGELMLTGVVYMPRGEGPFPAVLWNHGSWHDPMVAFDQLAPTFTERGWVLFGPFRRGQGLSAGAGPYIQDELRGAWGSDVRAAKAVSLLTGPHLDDQLAAYAWLKQQSYVLADQIAVAGNSFGGIETVLGAERVPYCAAVNAAGASESWASAPQLRDCMLAAARNSHVPMFLFQAENDFDLTPTHVIAATLRRTGTAVEEKIYPPFGDSDKDGHSFSWRGSQVWAPDVLSFIDRHCRGLGR